MIYAQAVKYQVAMGFLSATNGQTINSDAIDCQGADYLTLEILMTAPNVVSNVPSVISVLVADVTTVSSAVAVPALTQGTAAGNFTAPTAAPGTAGASLAQPYAVLGLPLQARPRYAFVQITPVTTQTFVVNAILSRKEQAPIDATHVNATVFAQAAN